MSEDVYIEMKSVLIEILEIVRGVSERIEGHRDDRRPGI